MGGFGASWFVLVVKYLVVVLLCPVNSDVRFGLLLFAFVATVDFAREEHVALVESLDEDVGVVDSSRFVD